MKTFGKILTSDLNESKVGVVNGLLVVVIVSEGWHGVEAHAHCGEEHQGYGHQGQILGNTRLVRLLKSVPQNLLINCKLTWTKVFNFIFAGFLISFLLLHGLLDELLPGGELVLAAQLQPDRINAPVLQILSEVMNTHIIH